MERKPPTHVGQAVMFRAAPAVVASIPRQAHCQYGLQTEPGLCGFVRGTIIDVFAYSHEFQAMDHVPEVQQAIDA